jgi:tetratricopeptide (TPR) repeat protein
MSACPSFHARRTEDERAERNLVVDLIGALYHGPTPASEAIAGIEELMAQAGGQALEAFALAPLAGLPTMQGDFDEGRALYERSKAIRLELGLTLYIPTGTAKGREIHMLAGHVEEAERELRWGYETLEQMGDTAVRSTLAAELAEALYCQRYEEAEYFVRAGLEVASPKDVASQVIGHTVEAKLLGVKGMGDRAERTARDAVALAETTDDLFTCGEANLALAEVLLLIDKREEAIKALEAAADASDRKGNIVSAERARALLTELER